ALSVLRAWSISAATAAASGAAADVPKKLGRLSVSAEVSAKKKVVFPPSGAVICGVWRRSGVASALPAASNTIFVGPAEEYVSIWGGLTPNAGVLTKDAAPTAIASAAAA